MFRSPRKRGDCKKWLAHADPDVKKLSETVNGPILELLAKRIKYKDAECIEMFRKGILL
jgi:hypothetical protein